MNTKRLLASKNAVEIIRNMTPEELKKQIEKSQSGTLAQAMKAHLNTFTIDELAEISKKEN